MILALVGGICVYAPKHYFPLAVQVLSAFQSLKILPGVLLTFVKPFGHGFKVTPKGSAARSESYNREVFWSAAILMFLTAIGILINAIPEWRIIPPTALIPVVAAWSAYNILLLFLVCMLALQAREQRGEERFTSDEPVWIIGPGGTRTQMRLKDISLSGAGLLPVPGGSIDTKGGEAVQMFIPEVGYIPGRIARHSGQLVGIHFELGPSLERDLLIRKLFTSGLVATTVSTSAWSTTAALLESIWLTPTAVQSADGHEEVTPQSPPQLPAETLVVPPHAQQSHWAALAKQRRAVA
jgi:cellulose synthase (UDP-forming)